MFLDVSCVVRPCCRALLVRGRLLTFLYKVWIQSLELLMVMMQLRVVNSLLRCVNVRALHLL